MQQFSTLLVSLILQTAVDLAKSSDISNISWPVPKGRPKLEIWPELIGPELKKKLLLHKKDEPLNMTCTVVFPENNEDQKPSFNFTVDWKLPTHLKNNGETQIKRGQAANVAWLWFEKLAEMYAGDYKCLANSSESEKFLSTVIHLSVKHTKHKIKYCSPVWFKCHSSNCITRRYLCDGKPDCEDGEDEGAEAGCPPDPCAGKIICGDRCISSEWCCDQYNYATNCSLKSQYTRPIPPSVNPAFSDINFLQTTTYVLIGCATVFMFIFTILVIAICRLQMKRAMACRLSEQLNFRSHRRVPFHDLDIYISRSADSNRAESADTTYNISSGVPLTSGEPPPYSEVVFATCNEDLPPPYRSNEDLLCPSMTARTTLPIATLDEASRTLQDDRYSRKEDHGAGSRERDDRRQEDVRSSIGKSPANKSVLSQTQIPSAKSPRKQEREIGSSGTRHQGPSSSSSQEQSHASRNASSLFGQDQCPDAESLRPLLPDRSDQTTASGRPRPMPSTNNDDAKPSASALALPATSLLRNKDNPSST